MPHTFVVQYFQDQMEFNEGRNRRTPISSLCKHLAAHGLSGVSNSSVSSAVSEKRVPETWWPHLHSFFGVPDAMFQLLNYLDQMPTLGTAQPANERQQDSEPADDGASNVDALRVSRPFEQMMAAWHAVASVERESGTTIGTGLFLAGDVMMKPIEALADISLQNRTVTILSIDPIGIKHGEYANAPLQVLATQAYPSPQHETLLYSKFITSALSLLTKLTVERPLGLSLRWIVRQSRRMLVSDHKVAPSNQILANEYIALQQEKTVGPCLGARFSVSSPGSPSWTKDIVPLRDRCINGNLVEGEERMLLEYRDGEFINGVDALLEAIKFASGGLNPDLLSVAPK